MVGAQRRALQLAWKFREGFLEEVRSKLKTEEKELSRRRAF